MDPWGNIIVVENGDWQRYYWPWAGRRILDMLVGGPGLARRHINTFERCVEGEWTSADYCSGGALMDFDRTRLLFFGDELMTEMPRRRAMLNVLTDVWAGYEVGWAYDGIIELAGYVGEKLHPVPCDHASALVAARDRNWLCQLVSVVVSDGTLRMWPLTPYSQPASFGPQLIGALPGRGVKKMALRTIPMGGVHVDLPRMVVGVWDTGETPEVLDGLPQAWSGWTVDRWDDRYEEQIARCGGALRVPALDLRKGIGSALELIRERLFHCRWDGPAAEALSLAEALSRAAPGFAVSADAVLNGLILPNEDEWGRFARACESLRLICTQSA